MLLQTTKKRSIRLLSLTPTKSGFSLIVTVTMMILLSLIAVGLLTLSSTVLRSSSQNRHAMEAQANARLALMLAVGQLQKHAGPDQRVTARGDILANTDEVEPLWTGVWDTTEPDSEPIWLVSGPSSDRANSSLFKSMAHDPANVVTAPSIPIRQGDTTTGTYAYWISDEGVKARLDLGRTPEDETDPLGNNPISFVSGSSDIVPSLNSIAQSLEGLEDPELNRNLLISQRTVELAVADHSPLQQYSHDLTTGGYGLPINVVKGKFKNDLSTIFDASHADRDYLSDYLGGNASLARVGGATFFDFQATDPEKFYFVDELTQNSKYKVGPNWGILYNYAKLPLSNGSSNSLPLVPTRPTPQCDLRESDWPPYREHVGSELGISDDWSSDIQHTNSSVAPVLAHIQMTFALGTRTQNYVDARGRNLTGQRVQLWMKPVIGLWNPYNITISDQDFRIDWALYPYLRIGIESEGQQTTPRIWMREHWKGASQDFNAKDQYFSLSTPSVDLEPGEMRLFSVKQNTNFGGTNLLESGWGEENGWFKFDLNFSAKESTVNAASSAGEPIIAPSNSKIWYGDLFLEDSQHIETLEHFGSDVEDLAEKGASASWITLKSGDEVIHRIPDIWASTTPGSNPDFFLPEQVVSQWVRTGTTSTKQQVETLNEAPMPIGTWAFYARTTQDAAPAISNSLGAQNTRGWIDTNPRFIANSPLWDGSNSNARGGYDGWFFSSPFVGGSLLSGSSWNGHNGTQSSINAITSRSVPEGRGLIAEGQLGQAEPEISDFRRFSGIGGNTMTNASGQKNTILFDVPRSALVSIGQFQHAQLSRYGFEPSYVVGNSYNNVHIEDPSTQGAPVASPTDYNGVSDHQIVDSSYYTNRVLFDDYFFSTLGADYHNMSTRSNLSQYFDLEKLRKGEQTLPNPRLRFAAQDSDKSLDAILDEADAYGPEAIASRIQILGAFNVNSTSIPAWKAFLASLENLAMPQIPEGQGDSMWIKDLPARLSRFGSVLEATGWNSTSGDDSTFWRGFRELAPEELDDLATAIVEEIKARGPFLSLADFVNRDPYSSEPSHRYSGAVQAALDRTLNSELPSSIGENTEPITNQNGLFSNDYSDNNGLSSTAGGSPSYTMQGDVFQALAPVMTVRSDYFRIRASGESVGRSGQVVSRAVCEAYVQRIASYVDSDSDSPEVWTDELQSKANQNFGRRFRITSFRWLAPEEV